MRYAHAVLLLVLLAVPASASSPEAAVSAAAADIRKVPADRVQQVRYLSLYWEQDRDALAKFDKTLRFVANSLSTEVDFGKVEQATPGLWRIELDAFAWRAATWEKLLDDEPYFHLRIFAPDVQEVVEEVPYGYYLNEQGRAISRNDPTWTPQSRWVQTHVEKVKKKKEVKNKVQVASAPWVNPVEIAELIRLTNSQVPIIRADWWLWQVFAAEGRKAPYYAWLGIKDEKTFQELGGADLKATRRLKLELRSVVGRSSVTLNAREIEFHGALTGSYWRSNDFAKTVDDKNPLRLLDGDAKPDAHEEFIRLPNGLWAVGLFNAEGKTAARAPDNIATDGKARGTERSVDVGFDCFHCHQKGLQDVNDWARRIYSAPLSLESPDYERQKRLRALYLRDMKAKIDAENVSYAAVLKSLNGLKPEENAEALADAYYAFEIGDLDIETQARELGVKAEVWERKLKAAGRLEKKLDPVLGAALQGLPLRREHWAEVFPSAMKIAREGP